mmetsp:Transcript_124848/g.347614  ORF Transcript_124848/g.347614 Transcript_124848/m.347614 type:complete len:229 (-) Transcript_124848:239-925(-)
MMVLLLDNLHGTLCTCRSVAGKLHQAVRALPEGLVEVVHLLRVRPTGRCCCCVERQGLAEVTLDTPEQVPEGLAEALHGEPAALQLLLLGEVPEGADAAADAQLGVQLSTSRIQVLRAQGGTLAQRRHMVAEHHPGLLIQAAFAQHGPDPLELGPPGPCPWPQPPLLLLAVKGPVGPHAERRGARLRVHVEHNARHPATVGVAEVLGLHALHQLTWLERARPRVAVPC